MHEVQLFNNIIPHIFMGAKIKLLDILGFFLDNKRKETWIYMLVFLNLIIWFWKVTLETAMSNVFWTMGKRAV